MGAYDQDGVYGEVAARHPDAAVIVPPRSSGVPSETAENAPTPRDRHLQAIAEHGRMGWQKASGYGLRWAKRRKSRPFACAAAGRLTVERRSSRGRHQLCQSARRGYGSCSLAWRQSAACKNGRASLWQANLRDADLSYAGLQKAKLDHADLSGANLDNADLTGASLWGARLSGTRLEHAVGITDDQLKNAQRA